MSPGKELIRRSVDADGEKDWRRDNEELEDEECWSIWALLRGEGSHEISKHSQQSQTQFS